MLNRIRKIRLIKQRLHDFHELANPCQLCPRRCFVSRKSGVLGNCRAGWQAKIAVALPHFGEEPPLSGIAGSGTIFFSYCNLRCHYCQNHRISHHGHGRIVTVEELADIMLLLQQMKCHNINLVTPTHYMHVIVEALLLAFEQGLNIPIVYNSGGYESIDLLKLLKGIIDIYLPDAKYDDSHSSQLLSSVSDYPSVNRKTIKEMFDQVGPLIVDNTGIATSGLIVRHLVLPNNFSSTRTVLRKIMEITQGEATISVMGQYIILPHLEHEELKKCISEFEWLEVVKWLDLFDVSHGWIQKPYHQKCDMYVPQFDTESVFHFIQQRGLENWTIH